MQRILVTGGAGFIGSALCRRLVGVPGRRVVNVDSLTYAGNPASLRQLEGMANYRFCRIDVRDDVTILGLLQAERIDTVIHLAAETHVDRSIEAPRIFVETNTIGTQRLLDACLAYWDRLPSQRRDRFRFLQVSTDEVFGDLPPEGAAFTEATSYAPRSPYAASKASADHLVRAWYTTYGLPTLVSHCSNNYGPFQFPEKLIPLTILNALAGAPVTVYGTGANIRDWLFVEDHVRALELIAGRGMPGESYNIGGRAERTNLDVVTAICDRLDEARPLPRGRSHRERITFTADRLGHDRRYAIDPLKLETTLGWQPTMRFEAGLAHTVAWYLANAAWWTPLRRGSPPEPWQVAAE